jgi:hypothetical protein
MMMVMVKELSRTKERFGRVSFSLSKLESQKTRRGTDQTNMLDNHKRSDELPESQSRPTYCIPPACLSSPVPQIPITIQPRYRSS